MAIKIQFLTILHKKNAKNKVNGNYKEHKFHQKLTNDNVISKFLYNSSFSCWKRFIIFQVVHVRNLSKKQ